MGGKKFVEALLRIGYSRASKLDGDSFDWIFEFDALVPFLDWFSEEVQASNRLDLKDVEEFIVLEQSSEGILEDELLEEALQSFTESEEEMTEENLRQEIEQLQDELKCYQQRKDSLIQQRNRLRQHKTDLTSRLSKLESLDAEVQSKYKQKLDRMPTDNAKMNTALDSLVFNMEELNSLYEESKPASHDVLVQERHPIFLSQIELDDFFRMEEKFTTELTAFTKKKFFEGIAEMAGADEGSRFEFLEITNPELLIVQGEKEPALCEAYKEVARLQSHYPRNETLRINALVKEKTASVSCDFIERKLKQLKQKLCPRDKTELSNYLKDAHLTLAVLQQDLATLGELEIPSLIKESAKLQVACILQGNYTLKIARQDYFIGNQEQIIEQLLIQKARYEFLTMSFELEAKAHCNTYRLLTAIRTLLEDTAKFRNDRLQMLNDPMLTSSRSERSTLDSRDKFFTKLHQLLDVGELTGHPQLFLTYQQLLDKSEKLNSCLGLLRASSSTVNTSQDDRIHILEKTLTSCETSMYSGSSTPGTKPAMTPQPIFDLLLQLGGMVKQLESSVLDVVKDIEKKKKSLHSDPLLVTERELFVFFFNDPDRLRRVIADVSERLAAHLVK